MRSRWTPELLNLLRQVGDPWLDREARNVLGHKNLTDFLTANATRNRPKGNDPLTGATDAPADPDRWNRVDKKPGNYWRTGYDWRERLDPADVELAQDLFIRQGSEIGAVLLLASLPHNYAVEAGAWLLNQTKQLNSEPERRILRTAEFLLNVMIAEDKPDPATVHTLRTSIRSVDPRIGLLPGGQGYLAARRTRLLHSVIRGHVTNHDPFKQIDGQQVGVLINQEFLLGTNLSFCVTVWESLERLGIRWTADQRTAYFNTWDWVGHLMGIGLPHTKQAILALPERDDLPDRTQRSKLLQPFKDEVLRPRDVGEANELMALIRDRNWPAPEEVGAFQNANGKELVNTLLAELEDAMPPLQQALPLTAMRYLADNRVTVALGLGGGGLPKVALDYVQGQSRGWNLGKANPMVAPAMRAATNQVSLHAFAAFIETGEFVFPGMVGRRSTMKRNRSKKEGRVADAVRFQPTAAVRP